MSVRLAWVLVLAAAACSGRQRRAPQPPSVCTSEVRPGLQTRAFTWNGQGWGAVIPEGPTLYLREFSVTDEPVGERVVLADEPSTPARVSVAWSNGAYYVAVAPAAGPTPARVFRATASNASGDAYALTDAVSGDARVVARAEVSGAPAALVYESANRAWLRVLDRDGDPKTPRECPEGLLPLSVVARGDGFRALVSHTDPDSGSATTLDVVALDDECRVDWRTRVWEGTLDGRVHALAADEHGAVIAFTTPDRGAWIARVDDQGTLRGAARPMERAARSPKVFLLPGGAGVRVVAIRRDEVEDRLERWQFDREGNLREVRPISAASAIEVMFTGSDPWGGGVVGFTRSGLTHGAPVGASRLVFQVRVCP